MLTSVLAMIWKTEKKKRLSAPYPPWRIEFVDSALEEFHINIGSSTPLSLHSSGSSVLSGEQNSWHSASIWLNAWNLSRSRTTRTKTGSFVSDQVRFGFVRTTALQALGNGTNVVVGFLCGRTMSTRTALPPERNSLMKHVTGRIFGTRN